MTDQDVIKERLKRALPLRNLPDESLDMLRDAGEVIAFDTGQLLVSPEDMTLRADEDVAPVFLLMQGRIDLNAPENRATVRRIGPDTLFGYYSAVRKIPYAFSAIAVSEGEMLRIPGSVFLEIMARHRFVRDWVYNDINQFERELGRRGDAEGASFLFGQRLRDLVRHDVLIAGPDTRVIEAARLMNRDDRDSLLVAISDHDRRIFSDADLRRLLGSDRLTDGLTLAEAALTRVVSIRERASVFEGVIAMELSGQDHVLLVDDDDKPKALLALREIAHSMLGSVQAIRQQISVAVDAEAMRHLRLQADQALVRLYRRGLRAELLLSLNTGINDALVERALQLAQQGYPAAPQGLRWCWLSLGSEGRGEMSLHTDQDNAILFDGVDPETARRWLLPIAQKANDSLDQVGLRRCSAGIMAGNPLWCQNAEGFGRHLRAMMKDTESAALLGVPALFDARPVTGDNDLITKLHEVVRTAVDENRRFIRRLAIEVVSQNLPISGLTQKLVGQRAADGRKEKVINTKRGTSQIIVDLARVRAMQAGYLESTGTWDRLAHVARERGNKREDRDAREAFDFLIDLRIGWHVEQRANGEKLENFMPLSELGHTRRRLLAAALRTVREMQAVIRREFGL